MVKVKYITFAAILVFADMTVMAADGGMPVGAQMAILQWICFAVLMAVGYKMAWKPILANLTNLRL